MQATDFNIVNQWCIDEGWNIGLYDSAASYKMDPFGHFIATESNPVASLSLIKHSPTFFTLGPFIVQKSYRKQGIGEALWNVAMSRMNKEHPAAHIVLYAVSQQVERYKKSGFTPVQTIQRWYLPSNISSNNTSQCTAITQKQIPALKQYNEKNNVINQIVLSELLFKPDTKGLLFVVDDIIKGFGMIRRCVRGFRIGSLVADTPEIAQALIAELFVFAQGESVFIDVPDSTPESVSLLNAFNATREPLEDTIMMIKGSGYSDYLHQRERLYGLFSLEIG